MIEPEVKNEIDRMLQFSEAPGPSDLLCEVREFVRRRNNERKTVNQHLVINYLRHHYTNASSVMTNVQAQIKDVWSVKDHHEIRDYINELVWRQYDQNIPFGLPPAETRIARMNYPGERKTNDSRREA